MSVLERGSFEKMFEAAVLCRERALDVPMLVLIYTSLDTLAWAIYGHETNEGKRRFIALCESYVLPESAIQCTALELYAARCSIIHSLGWESDLSKSGKARAVFYSFGTDDPRLAQEALEHTRPGEFIAVRADELLASTQRAVDRVAQQAKDDSSLAARLAVAEGRQYRSLESSASDLIFGRFIEMVQKRECTP